MSKYVPYHKPSVEYAKKLTADAKSAKEKFQKITAWATKSLSYDYIRAVTIPKTGGMPDVDRCWETRMGICFDIASMVTGMLRAVGVRAYLYTGKADGQNHAWVVAEIDGKKYRYDHSGKAKVYKKERVF